MNTHSDLPNKNIAAAISKSMTGENVLSLTRLATDDQHFVFAVKTENEEFVLRMTAEKNRSYFISAIYWQEKLIPLGIPLAKFIKHDLDREFSPFPALLMKRLPGDDLCNVYLKLNNLEKENLAKEPENDTIRPKPNAALLAIDRYYWASKVGDGWWPNEPEHPEITTNLFLALSSMRQHRKH